MIALPVWRIVFRLERNAELAHQFRMDPETPPPPDPQSFAPKDWSSPEGRKQARLMEITARRLLDGEFGEAPPEIVEAAKRILKLHAGAHALDSVEAMLLQTRDLLHRMAREGSTEELIQAVQEAEAKFDAAVDEMLSVPEPKRSELMKPLLALREIVRGINRR